MRLPAHMRRGVLALVGLAVAAPAPAAAAPDVHRYDLGGARLALPNDQPVPLRLQGLVGIPETPGPAPIVVVLHGRLPACASADPSAAEPWPCPAGKEIRYDLGLRGLVTALATAGFVAVAPDLNGAYSPGIAEPADGGVARADAVLARTLARLVDAGAGRAPGFGALAGRIDPTRLGLVGLGRGGETAMYAARQNAGHADPLPGVASDGRLAVDGALLAAPTYSPVTTLPQPDVPIGVVLPSCDGVVIGLDGANYADVARQTPKRESLAATVFLRGANDGWFDDAAAKDDAANLPIPACRPGAPERLTRSAQTDFLAGYAATFLGTALRGDPPTNGLDPLVRPPSLLFGARVVTSLTTSASRRLVVLEPKSGANLRVDALGGKVTPRKGVTLAFCAPARRCKPALQQPSYRAQASVTWTRRGASLRFGVPARRGQLAGYTTLALRVAVDPTAAENGAGLSQSFSIVLQDAAGKTARVAVPATEPALAYPTGLFRVLNGPWGHVPLGAVRVSTDVFTGIDRDRLRSISLVFDRTVKGSLLVADLELIAPPPPAATP